LALLESKVIIKSLVNSQKKCSKKRISLLLDSVVDVIDYWTYNAATQTNLADHTVEFLAKKDPLWEKRGTSFRTP